MGLFGKSARRKVTEDGAADAYVLFADKIEGDWTKTCDQLSRVSGPDASILEAPQALREFTLAAIYCNSTAIRNLFPPEQSKRIYTKIMSLVVKRFDREASTTIIEYQEVWKQALASHPPQDPLLAVAGAVMHRCGASSSLLMKRAGIAGSPLLQMGLQAAILAYGDGYWKMVCDKYELTP